MLTVACVLADPTPGKPRTYGPEHVERLRQQVAGHLEQPHRFVCLDDSPFLGWWAKVSLFEPGRFTGRVLYLDLDITIVGGLDEVADYPAPFAAMRDALNPGINSSVMLWTAGQQDHIYSRFTPADMDKNPFGDQQWIGRVALPSKFPKAWFPSYKYDLHKDIKNMGPETKAVIYHGVPKPWDLDG